MKNSNLNNSEKIFALLESGNDPKKILNIFPEKKKEIREILFIINSLRKEREKINAPKEILEKIFKEEPHGEKNGRFSALETLYSLIINNLKLMNQKSKLSIVVLGVFALSIIGIIIFGPLKNNSKVAENLNLNQMPQKELAIVTTSAATGDQEVDASINSVLNDILSEDDLDAELSDIDLALSDIENLDQINNLFNDNEL